MANSFDKQNMAISALVLVAQISLLWLGSHSSTLWLVLAAFAFSFLGLTLYALIHEACHYNLHSNQQKNDIVGALVSCLFPVSFTFMKTVHEVHHLNNRSDHEMFDYYYPDDNLFIKYAQWYSILLGIYPPIIPIGSVLLAVVPGLFQLQPWKTARSSNIIFDRGLFSPAVLRKIRIEVCGGILFWCLLFVLLELNWIAVLVMYAVFWFNWSTRQYVTHAFSPRDVIEGAWNLKVSRLMGWIFLQGQWDKVHHKDPQLRWQALPAQGKNSQLPIPYWSQYFRLWQGPRPNPVAVTTKFEP